MSLPHDGSFESTLALLRDGYEFIVKRHRRGDDPDAVIAGPGLTSMAPNRMFAFDWGLPDDQGADTAIRIRSHGVQG